MHSEYVLNTLATDEPMTTAHQYAPLGAVYCARQLHLLSVSHPVPKQAYPGDSSNFRVSYLHFKVAGD